MRISEKAVPVAAALSAVATLACCLPFGFAGAVGVFGLGVAFVRIQPWLFAIAVVLLGFGFVQIYRGRRSCRRPSRVTWTLYGFSAALVAAVALFPQLVAEWMAALP